MSRQHRTTTIMLTALVYWCLLGITAAEAQEFSAIFSQIVVKVQDRDQAADALVDAVEAVQGYFAEISQDGVKLKVPMARTQHIIEFAAQLGEVVDQQYRRDDLTDEFNKKQAALKAKQTVLDMYLEVLRQADTDTLILVENQIIELTAEIETLKGAIRLLQHRMAFAQVQVLFQFKDRSAPVASGTSSFAWLNTFNLADLLEDY